DRRGQEAQHTRQPATAGAVRLASMADAGHARTGSQDPGRPAVTQPSSQVATSGSRANVGYTRAFLAVLALFFVVSLPADGMAEATDPVTGFARDLIHVAAWPGGKKVAVSFALFVEEFGFGQGPIYRPDLASRNPDLVNEAFRQYGIDWDIVRVGRLFKELD